MKLRVRCSLPRQSSHKASIQTNLVRAPRALLNSSVSSFGFSRTSILFWRSRNAGMWWRHSLCVEGFAEEEVGSTLGYGRPKEEKQGIELDQPDFALNHSRKPANQSRCGWGQWSCLGKSRDLMLFLYSLGHIIKFSFLRGWLSQESPESPSPTHLHALP